MVGNVVCTSDDQLIVVPSETGGPRSGEASSTISRAPGRGCNVLRRDVVPQLTVVLLGSVGLFIPVKGEEMMLNEGH